MTLPFVSPAPGGPAGRYLTNPGAFTEHLARILLAAIWQAAPLAGPVLAAVMIAVLAGRPWLHRRQHAEFAARARIVKVLAPPQADPDGATALWGHLTGLLRPAWARWWHGQPHLGWEYAWTGGAAAGMTIRLWVPGTIPPGLIERAVEAAWPGAHTVTTSAVAALPADAAAIGGTLRLARPEILPLGTSHDPDAPLRALAGQRPVWATASTPLSRCSPAQSPEPGYAAPAALPASSAPGSLPGCPPALLDLATPGGTASSRRRNASRSDPELAAEIRAATEKLASPQWETLIRYGVATTAVTDQAGRRQDRAAATSADARLRGLAHAIASATALHSGRNWLARRHLRHPAAAVNSRRLRRGDLLSVPELAAIARLPCRSGPARPGPRRGTSRPATTRHSRPRPGHPAARHR